MISARHGLLILVFLFPCYSFRAFPSLCRSLTREGTGSTKSTLLRPNFSRASTSATTTTTTTTITITNVATTTPIPPPTIMTVAAAASPRQELPRRGCRARRSLGRRPTAVTALRASAEEGAAGNLEKEDEGEEASADTWGEGGGKEGEGKEGGVGDETSAGVAAAARSQDGGGVPGGRGNSASEEGVDSSSGDGAMLGGGAESMELRDFRARLMSKGLDGWGAERAEEASGGPTGSTTSERWAHPLVRPELGCLVIAKEGMFTRQQQYFYKAVAVVIQHDDDGTVALILNRPTAFTMGEVCTGDLHRVPGMEDNVLYMAGDVGGARDDGLDVVNLMHAREDVPALEVVKGLRLGGLKEALALIAKGEAQPEEFKFFSRYSGWGPGQLEAEVLGGAWELAACDLGSVLQNQNHPDNPGHFWEDIMSRLRRHPGSSGSGSAAAVPDG